VHSLAAVEARRAGCPGSCLALLLLRTVHLTNLAVGCTVCGGLHDWLVGSSTWHTRLTGRRWFCRCCCCSQLQCQGAVGPRHAHRRSASPCPPLTQRSGATTQSLPAPSPVPHRRGRVIVSCRPVIPMIQARLAWPSLGPAFSLFTPKYWTDYPGGIMMAWLTWEFASKQHLNWSPAACQLRSFQPKEPPDDLLFFLPRQSLFFLKAPQSTTPTHKEHMHAVCR
jgi:hypothetical protein